MAPGPSRPIPCSAKLSDSCQAIATKCMDHDENRHRKAHNVVLCDKWFEYAHGRPEKRKKWLAILLLLQRRALGVAHELRFIGVTRHDVALKNVKRMTRPVTTGRVGVGGRPPVCRQKVCFRRWKKVFEHAIKLKFRFVSLGLYCQMKSQTQ